MRGVREANEAFRYRYLTENLRGTGGRIRAAPEDFRVEELPLRPPEGAGEHLYLWIEKRDLSTLEALRALRRILEVPEREAGVAGLKDARAVARQWISFRCPGRGAERRLERREGDLPPGLLLLEVTRGRAKLRRGALRGNRFEIIVRGAGPSARARAEAVLEVLVARGLPNAFGDQRFGVRGRSAELGRALALDAPERALALLLGARPCGLPEEAGAAPFLLEARERFEADDYEGARRRYPPGWEAERRVLSRLLRGAPPERAIRAFPARERGLCLSAFQAAVFNECLARRLMRDAHDRLLEGDVVFSHGSGSLRRVGDAAKEEAKRARFALSPAGPLWGGRMLSAGGEAGKMEARVLADFGLHPEAVAAGLMRFGLGGGRRPYRVRPEEVRVAAEGEDLRLRFTLPPGAYATEVLREVTKGEPPLGEKARLRRIAAGRPGGATEGGDE